jgi:competence protein ComEA
MRISEFKKVLKSDLFNPKSATRNPQFLRHLSLGQQKVLVVLALLLLILFYFKFYYSSSDLSEKIAKEVILEVRGEIPKPGVYLFEHPPTLKEAIERAGGFNEKVSLESRSSSEILETGTLITIQRKTPSPPVGEGGDEGELIKINIGTMDANKLLLFNIPLDLNQVSVEDLCLLPGVGEVLAREIIAYRQKRRGFRSIEELNNVKGIGDKTYQSIKTFFIVRPQHSLLWIDRNSDFIYVQFKSE